MPRTSYITLTFILLIALVACDDAAPTPAVDAGASDDVGVVDAGGSDLDAGAAVDVGARDAGAVADSGAPDSGSQQDLGVSEDAGQSMEDAGALADAGADAGAEDMGSMEPDDRCMFLDLDVRYVTCEPGQDYQVLRYFQDPNLGDALCPPYFVLRGTRYTSAEEALAGERCDGTCQWTPRNSFTVIRCNRRTGYELWTAPDCDDIYVTPDGVYPSVMAWEIANPC